MPRWNRVAVVALIAMGLSPLAAPGVIKNILPLDRVLAEQELIFVAKVDKLLPDKPAMILAGGDSFKGKSTFSRMPVNLAGDKEGQREKHPAAMLKRLAVGTEIIFFVNKNGDAYEAFGFTNGTWFQMIGHGDKPEDVKWLFTHCEPYLRRTFKGTTEELKKVVTEGLAGKQAPPKPNEKEAPGLGPELKPSDPPPTPRANAGPSSLPFAVVPTMVFVAPLAILAALFPTVFGGLALMMRRWTAALSISSLVSTIYFCQMYFLDYLAGTWMAKPVGLWSTLAVLSVMGAIWAGVRYRAAIRDADFDTFQPGKWDDLILMLVSAGSVCGLFGFWYFGKPLLSGVGLGYVVSCVPVWVATASLLFVRTGPEGTSAFSLESAFLWGLVFACGNVAALEYGRSAGSGFQITSDTNERKPRPTGAAAWEFAAPGGGTIYSKPLVAGERIYLSVLNKKGLSQSGTVYCLDADSGKEIWHFNDEIPMKPAFSSPVLADGRIFVGEGNHEDHDCRLFCLDAATGKKVWEFETTSHTESTPIVANGKVYFGAGDDGIFCVNASDGTKVWNYPNVHVDANPIVDKGRLYVGSGVGDKFRETVLLCLDADKGTEIWKMPVEEAAFAPPALDGNQVYFGIGNGDYVQSKSNPVGALLCVDSATGKTIWRCDVADTVLGKPTFDSEAVYFTARDGNCYSVNRTDGVIRWKQSIGGPSVSSPTLVPSSTVRSLYVATTEGRVTCLSPDDGRSFWSLELSRLAGFSNANIYAPPVVTPRREGKIERRQIIIAAGVSNGATPLPRVYCLEDEIR